MALNESLTKLGDWVMLEAEDQGLSQAQILERLREVVRGHAESVQQEQERTEVSREGRRIAPPLMRLFEQPNSSQIIAWSYVNQGKQMITVAMDRKVTLWDAETFAPLHEFETPDEVIASQSREAIPHILILPGSDEFLVAYESILAGFRFSTGGLAKRRADSPWLRARSIAA